MNGGSELNKHFLKLNLHQTFDRQQNHFQHTEGQQGDAFQGYIDGCLNTVNLKKAESSSSPAKNEMPSS